jgi:plastocyanin
MRASGGTPEGFLSSSWNVRAAQTLARGVNDHPRLTKASKGSGRRFGPFGRVPVAVVVALALLVSGTASVRSVTPASVEIRDSKYAPTELTVAPGTTVRWVNHDEETHTVTSNTEAFKSGGLNLDDEYTHTFTVPGVYPYTCALHDFMQGTIVVK